MDKLEYLILEALNKYFNTVTAVGFVNPKDTYSILLLLYLRNFLEDYMEEITEEDYKFIYKLIECLQGTCFIGSTSISEFLPVDLFKLQEIQRITENHVLRLSQLGSLREREY